MIPYSVFSPEQRERIKQFALEDQQGSPNFWTWVTEMAGIEDPMINEADRELQHWANSLSRERALCEFHKSVPVQVGDVLIDRRDCSTWVVMEEKNRKDAKMGHFKVYQLMRFIMTKFLGLSNALMTDEFDTVADYAVTERYSVLLCA